MTVHRYKLYDHRVEFTLPTHLRAANQQNRRDATAGKREHLTRQWYGDVWDIWFQETHLADHDDHLDKVIREAQCLSPVRGQDYVTRQLSTHMGELAPAPVGGDGDPDSLDNGWFWDYRKDTEAYREQVRRDLAGEQ